jgi:hypothetical protein
MRRISVISASRPDAIAVITRVLGEAGVDIETLLSEARDGMAVAILTVDRYDAALRALAGAGLCAVSEDALLVRLDDRSGAVAELARRFRDAELDLRSVRIVRRTEGKSLVAVAAARTERAIALVQDMLVF